MTSSPDGSGAGLVVREDWGVLRVTGRDHVDYLQRMTSQDVAGLEAGHAAYALVLHAQGGIIGDPVAWRLPDAVLLTLDPRGREGAGLVLERYVIADDVDIADLSDAWCVLELIGDASGSVLADLGVSPPEEGVHVEAEIGGKTTRILRRDLGRRPAFTLLAPSGHADAVVGTLDRTPGVTRLREADLDHLRVMEGVPAYGAELGPGTMPLEALLGDTAICWTKGCYPGQEPVVMARHRGKPANLLVRVAATGDDPPPPGTRLLREGRRVGRITTAVRTEDGVRGLALLRHALAGEASTFDLEGGGRVHATPLAP